METVRDFIFGDPKITVDGDFSHGIKKTLTPWKKSYDQPRQNIKKQRHYLANKGPSSQSYGFSLGIYEYELDHKMAEFQRNAFELWCWRILLRFS